MKVIDLLNKIANGEEVPKKFKYGDEIYKISIVIKDNGECWYNYINEDTTCLLFDNSELNNEIEIIEDTSKEDKKIKKLDTYVDIASFNHFVCYDEDESLNDWTVSLQKGLEEQTKFNRDVLYKINELIDKVNKL